MTDTAKAISTKDRILDAAERLFAEKGFAQTSLRDITAEAAVNLAAVNYHFQSKEHLIGAVFERRIGPVTERRLAMLDQLEEEAEGGPVSVEGLLRAVIEPVLRMVSTPEGACAANLIGRAHTEPGDIFEHLFTGQFARVAQRVLCAARRSLPELSEVELLWRMQFAIGAMSHVIAGQRHIKVVSGGRCDTSDVEGMLDRLIAFVAAGCRAPAVSTAKGEPA
jgi:AcrR family transcriptional regulator